ncbi:MAG TPA: SLBB domain-containing protein [Patescibacteria group bacterium]|nr:SLBB domain-containing protein [Patescibacteria group bacterium]
MPQFKFNPRAGEYDTVGFKKAEEISKDAAGILETEIDPAQYILGPGDVLHVFVLTSITTELDAVVSPEGKLLLPNIGIVNLKNKSLAQADSIVRQRIEKVYKAREVAVSLKKLRTFKVSLLGAVRKPTMINATAADRISEVIDRAGGLLHNSSLRRIVVEREGATAAIEADLQKFYSLGDKSSNPTVLGGDRITIPYTFEKQTITVLGDVALPGVFEFKEGDRLSVALRFAQGFLPSSYLDSIEIVRFRANGVDIERIFFDASTWVGSSLSSIPESYDITLKSGDRIFVRTIPEWQKSATVAVRGEVKYPGTYAITKNSTRLKDVIAMAGGFTENAALESSVLVRRKELEVEDREYWRLMNVPQKDMSEDELRYFRARARENRGAIVVDFKNIETDAAGNTILEEKDSVHITSKRLFVNILGRVNSPGRIPFNEQYTYEDYIREAGGYGYRADKGRSVIIKPNGVQYPSDSRSYRIEPGDDILVPEEEEVKYGEIFTTGLTVLAQIITVIAVVVSLTQNNNNN